ncbi:D-alanyl-D-alanine carboxypeptidase [Alkaliphilus sp. MSJ-5]|uniref:D-alanyl-D-alanine carboxypeptidase n=1 Tax=Alkaliphilus flagellatus TaxID=2841507 RepID=A0ABS6G578_9FIRM|nr:D-alanyl-D-alanine carboxypeptidase family protein [Alkaliphilus flagellatus]MBU5677538.1 D-alanyl-D-alanine carboxypeptidase [Alkaliphilus flagellatus]
MRKKFNMFLCTLVIISLLLPAYNVSGEEQPFDINSKSALLMDAGTGTILYEKNIHEQLPPASVTKIMTMLLVMEAIDNNKITLNDKVVVSERASKMGGTQLYLEPGENKTVEELMKGVAIRSANDASLALGEYIAGTEELFIQQMNNRAKELGMKNTTFINTNGLPAEGHVTTAYDIALMSRELLKHKDIHKWLTTWMDTVVVGKRQSQQSLVNTNKLINTYKGANGIKTGYTSEALHCISASATRGNTTFIAVIMAAPTSQVRFAEASKLLDYGFANYNNVEIVKKDSIIGNVMLSKGKKIQVDAVAKDDLNTLVKKGDEANVQKEIILPPSIIAPVLQGDKLGEIIAKIDGKEIGRVDIVSKESIEKASIVNILGKMFNKMMGK